MMRSVRAAIYVAIFIEFLRRILRKTLAPHRKPRREAVRSAKYSLCAEITWQRGMDGPLHDSYFEVYRNIPFIARFYAWCVPTTLNEIAWTRISLEGILNNEKTGIRVVRSMFTIRLNNDAESDNLPRELLPYITLAKIDLVDTIEDAIDKVYRKMVQDNKEEKPEASP